EAFDRHDQLEDKMKRVTDPKLKSDWTLLQASVHFYYQCIKWFSDGDVHKYFDPYDSPYEAFIYFMNVVADFKLEVEKHLAERAAVNGEVENEIAELEARLKELRALTS